MDIARIPSDQEMTGIPSQGSLQEELVSLFHEWGHLTTDRSGEMGDEPRHGFVLAGTVLVSHYKVRCGRRTIIRTFNNQVSSTEWCSIGLISGSGHDGDEPGGKVPLGSIEVRTLRVVRGGWTERYELTNHSRKMRTVRLEIELGCPIEDKVLFKQSEGNAKKIGIKPKLARLADGGFVLRYRRFFGRRKNAPTAELRRELGSLSPRDGDPIQRDLEVRILAERVSVKRGRISRIRIDVPLGPRETREFGIEFSAAIDGVPVPAPKVEGIDPLPRIRSASAGSSTRILTGNSIVNLVLSQASTDLENFKLPVFGARRRGPLTLLAGVPGYESYFGDDSLTGAWQSCILSPDYLREALARSALYPGVREDPWRDEQEGRLAHQRRWHPLDVLGRRNKEIYYGDTETTPFWVISLATYFFWTGDLSFVREHGATLEGCIMWILRKMREGRGFLYYSPGTRHSTRNQGWKDSASAIVDAKGRVVLPPLATTELQGYAFLALLLSSILFLELGSVSRASGLFGAAMRLKSRFDRRFWMPGRRYYALALDRKARQVDAIASNAGHCLGCGILPSEKVPYVIAKLLSPHMFSGWGIRTLSSDNPAFDPFSYHRGSVWAAENATIAAGMRLCGYAAEADQVLEAQFAAATVFRQCRNPEVVAGVERGENAPIPGVYPEGNPLQLWSISANPFSIQVLLGLVPIAPLHLLCVDPFIPEWLSWIELHDLRVGESRLDLRFWRDEDGRSRWTLLDKRGHCEVIRQPMPFDPSASIGKRIASAVRSIAA